MTYTSERVNRDVYHPKYSTADALEYFEDIIGKFKNNVDEKNYRINGYNLLPTIYEDLYWRHCFNYIKYKTFFNKNGFDHTPSIKKTTKFLMDGYTRCTEIFLGDQLIGQLKLIINKIYLLMWVFKCYYNGLKCKIWIHPGLVDNDRYQISHILSNSKILKLNPKLFSVRSSKKESKTINDAIINTIIKKNNSFRFWQFAMAILKPKKIIMIDNLFDSYSILLAAKSSNIPIIGVSHGLVSYWHRGIIGSRHFSNDRTQLRYDVYYVWNKTMSRMMKAKGNIYSKDEIKESGWLRKLPDIIVKRDQFTKRKLVLYPYEWLSNHKHMMKLLNHYISHGYKIIIKTNPEIQDYDIYKKNNISLVENFHKEHYENASFILGSTTTMLIEMSRSGLPIKIANNDGFDMFKYIYLNGWEKIDSDGNQINFVNNNHNSNQMEICRSSFPKVFN